MIRKTMCLVVLIFFNLAFGVIIESGFHKQIFSHLKKDENTLVIFDLDNTLVALDKDAGSDQWFTHELKTRSLEDILPEYFQLQEKLSLQLTEPGLVGLFNDLKNQPNVIIIALTARSPELEQRTVSELDRLGFSFFHMMSSDDIVITAFHYHKGIIFSGSRDKGEVLKEILALTHMNLHHIIFVDDKLKNIISVEKAVEALHIPFTGIRYAGMDDRVKNFNPELAEKEKKELLA